MTIHCPACAFTIDLTGARPGRFTPACPNCHRRFALTIAPDLTPTVTALDQQAVQSQAFAGYQLVRKLADGATGAVYHARHLTLNRDVALKILAPAFSHDATAIDEARRAAALSHPNIVTVYDTGAAEGAAYIAYEFVPGPSLSDLLLRTGPLAPRLAGSYTAQLARALQAIHARNLLHKDVKPANVLQADATTVKLTDLGPTAGSPAYMSPEQVTRAPLTPRSDVYNLGATFYEFLTARPPFMAQTEQDLLAQHLTAPLTPPDALNTAVPPTLSRLAVRMLAKAPEDRPTLTEVLDTLDAYLATDTSPSAPDRARAVELLETAVDRFNHAPMAQLRPKLIFGFYALCAFLIFVAALLHSPTWAGGWIAFAVLMTASYLLLTGITGQSPLPAKLRELLLTATPKEWLWRLGVAVVLLLVIYLLGLHWLWLTFAVLAGAIAAAFHFSVDAILARERREPLEQVHLLLKSMRAKGESEDSIREFVYRNAGPNWEAFYETLFGYDAKLDARRKLAADDPLAGRRKHAPWRDPAIAWVDKRLEFRRGEVAQSADSVERSNRTDIIPVSARRKDDALLIPPPNRPDLSISNPNATPPPPPPPPAPPPEPPKQKRIIYGDEDDDGTRRPRRRSYLDARYGSPLALLVGPHVRLLLALPLLLGFALWVRQNNKTPEITSTAKVAIDQTLGKITGEPAAATQPATTAPTTAPTASAPLELPYLPTTLTHLFYDYRPAVAGLLLLLSAFSASTRLGLLLIPAAAIIFLAQLIPWPAAVAFPAETAGLIAGSFLALFAFLIARDG